MKSILHVVGARPNFMKMAPIKKQMDKYPESFRQIIVHTGQHYDENMSDSFFSDLSLSKPDYNLGVGSGTHAWQLGNVILKFEKIVEHVKPDIVSVVGDVNATLACALVCSKLGITVSHVEAGLRSLDRTMPEEINRLLTDQISEFLFTPSQDGNDNLIKEGISKEKIYFVGNVMIDSLLEYLPLALLKGEELKNKYHLEEFGLVTLHRPSNVDEEKQLSILINKFLELSKKVPLVFPMHPRTYMKVSGLGLMELINKSNLLILEPQSYIEFIGLQSKASFILTDSGGIQEESTFLKVPCLTLRKNTERPVTIAHGSNILIGDIEDRFDKQVEDALLEINSRKISVPPLWDGKTAERIVNVFLGQG